MKKKASALILTLILCLSMLVGCNANSYELSYINGYKENGEYNESLYYFNDLEAPCADPTVICITDKSDPNYGWFYMYPTSDIYNTEGVTCYRSRDMKSWEFVDIVFDPSDISCSQNQIWAPEVIYDEETDKYYMFFSARDHYRDETYFKNRPGITFRNYEEKAKYIYYFDTIMASYTFQSETNADGTSNDTNVAANDETIANLKSKLEARFAVIRALGANVEIPDGAEWENAYAVKMTEQMITDFEKRYSNLNFNSPSRKELISTAAELLSDTYTADIRPIFSQRANQIILAISDSPEGPFIQYTNDGSDGNRVIDETLPFIGAEDFYHWIGEHRSEYYPAEFAYEYTTDAYGNVSYGQMKDGNGITLIDVHPFVDPATGKKYLYFDCTGTNGPELTFLVVVEMGESWTDDPKWETATRLTRNGYYTVDDTKGTNKSTDLNEGRVNEGPFVYYNAEAKKYYLTMSINDYDSRFYAVIQAVGDSPMGPFRKLSKAEGGVLLASEMHWGHIAGPGHHCFVNFNGEPYIVYHTHYDTVTGSGQRGSCVDPVKWAVNGDGLTIMHVNGPTASLQPKLGYDAEYKNIATEATVKATNILAGSSASYLNDGLIRFYSWDDWLGEFKTGKKKETTITLTFADYRTIRSIMVYNTWDYDLYFDNIDAIELDFSRKMKSGKTEKGTAVIKDVKFDTDRYLFEMIEGEEWTINPGGSAVAEFYDMDVKEIRIKFNTSKAIAISEICVLGK